MSPYVLRRLSDESLGRRLASGEAAAFDELHRRYVHRLAAYGSQLLGDAAAGDDIAQASLLKAYSALRSGRLPEHVRPWLFRIAHNCAVDAVARRRELLLAVPDRPAPDRDHAAGDLVAALASLPDRQRHVFVLREVHGLRIDETAAELDLAPAQVEQALFAARNRLAEHLVFGERLSCVAVRRLATGPLDTSERRALKTHLRSCPACREAVASTGGLLGALPAGAADWLRALPGILAGGGAPAAVKAGAVVASAALATGAPIAFDMAKGAGSSHTSGPPLAVPAPPHHPRANPRRSQLPAPTKQPVETARRAPALVLSYRTPQNVRPRVGHGVARAASSSERSDAQVPERESSGAAKHEDVASVPTPRTSRGDVPDDHAPPIAASSNPSARASLDDTATTDGTQGGGAGDGSATTGDSAALDGGSVGGGSVSDGWSSHDGADPGSGSGGPASGDGQSSGD